MLKAAFVGAGGRAQSAHYPNVSRLEDARIEAVSELDESRMGEVVDRYGIPQAFGDYREMIDAVAPDVVYVIMGEEFMAPIAIDCMNAGRNVFIEKPAGASPEESHALLEAAEANGVVCAVGFQRRFADVTREAMRLVGEAGGATLAVGEFHKNMLGAPKPPRTTIWNDVCHAVDLIRYMAGSEVTDATAFQDARGSDWRNDFTAMMRFENGATGVLLANRSSGGRTLRSELHGLGVGCYMRIPERIEVLQDGSRPGRPRRRSTGSRRPGLPRLRRHPGDAQTRRRVHRHGPHPDKRHPRRRPLLRPGGPSRRRQHGMTSDPPQVPEPGLGVGSLSLTDEIRD